MSKSMSLGSRCAASGILSKACRLRSRAALVAAVAAASLFATKAQAVNYTWTHTTSDTSTWSAAGNWDANGAPTSSTGSVINFFTASTGPAGAQTANNDIAAAFTLNALNLNGNTNQTVTLSSALSSPSLIFDGTAPALNMIGSDSYTITENMTFNQATTFTQASGATGTLTVNNQLLAGTQPLTITNNSATKAMIFNGNGTSSAYTGYINITAGGVQLGKQNGILGSNTLGAQAINVGANASLILADGNAAYTDNESFILNGNGWNGNAALQVTGINFGNHALGNIAVAGAATISMTNDGSTGRDRGASLNGVLVGSANLTKLGSGTFYVNNNSVATTINGTAYGIYSGTLNANQGAVQFSGSSGGAVQPFGGTSGSYSGISVGNTGMLVVNNSNNGSSNLYVNLTLSGNGFNGQGALQLQNPNYGASSFGTLTIASDAEVSVTGSNQCLALGQLNGAGILTKVGTNILQLNSANSGYTGSVVVVNQGVLAPAYMGGGSGFSFGINSANITINPNGVFAEQGSFNASTSGLSQVVLNRITSGSAGGIALYNESSAANSNALNFTAAALANVFFGAVSDTTYNGTITPNATTGYRLGGGGGKLTVSSALSGSNNLTVGGPRGGSVVLSSATNSLNGTINVLANTLTLTGAFTSTPAVTLGGSGNFAYAPAAGATQNLGALAASAGDGIVTSTWASGTQNLVFASLATRTAGATLNFANSTGANGSTNRITITGASAGFVDQGTYFGGSNFAYVNSAGGYVRGINYSGDTNAATIGASTTGLPSGTYVQMTGAVTGQTGGTFTGLNISGANSLTLSSGTMTVSGLLKSGNNAATISGGTAIQAANNADLVIRTDQSSDSLTLSTPIAANGTNALVKSGLGTLTVGAAAAYTGTTYIDNGTLKIGVANALPTATTVTFAASGNTQTFDLNGVNQQLAGLAITAGGYPLNSIVTNSGAAATLTLTGNSTFNGTIQGSLGLTVNNSATVVLGNINTYTGTTTIAGGATIQLGVQCPLPGGSSLVLGSSGTGGTLDLNGFSQTLGSITLGSSATASACVIGNSSTTSDASLIVEYANGANFGGVIKDAIGSGTKATSMTVSGQTFTVSGANSYSGGTTVYNGTLQAGANAAFSPNSAVTLQLAGTMDTNGKTVTIANLTGTDATATANVSGSLTFGNASSTTFTGHLVGAGTLIKQGTGNFNMATVVDSSNLNTSFSGNVNLTAGTITVNRNHLAFGTSSSQLVTISSNASLILANSNAAYTQPQTFVVNGNGTGLSTTPGTGGAAAIDITGVNFGSVNLGKLAVASDSTVSVIGYDAGARLGNNGLSITGAVAGTGNLTKIGDNPLYLNVASATVGAYSAYTGNVNINAGILQFNQASNILGTNTAGTQLVTVADATTGWTGKSAAVVFNDNNSFYADPQNFSIGGSGTGYALSGGNANGSTAALQVIGVNTGNHTIGGLAVRSVGATVKVDGTGAFGLQLNGPLAGSGTLTKVGTNPLILTQAAGAVGTASAFSGIIDLQAGSLIVKNTTGSATGIGTVTLDGGTLASGSVGTISGAVSAGSGAHAIAPGGDGTIGTLNLGSTLSLNANSTLKFDIGTGTASDLLAITGALSVTGTPTLAFNSLGSLSGSYTLATFATSSLTSGSFNVPSLPAGYNLLVEATDIKLVPAGPITGSATWAVAGSGSWDLGTSWTPANTVPSAAGDTATFGDAISSANATVTLTNPKTVGTLAFTNTAGTYSIAGAALTLSKSGGSAITVASTSGAANIASQITLNTNTTVTVASPGSLNLPQNISSLSSSVGTLTKEGTGTASIAGATTGTTPVAVTLAGVTVNAGTLALAASSSQANRTVLVTSGLTMGGGTLEINNNDVLVHTGDITAVTTAIGNGAIHSQSVATDTTGRFGIGSILNTDGTNPITSTFGGQPANQTDVLIKYTYLGDANLDGKVDGTDYTRIDAGFGNATLKGWFNGDFNYDGTVDGSDYSLIDGSFGAALTQLPANASSMIAAPAASIAGPVSVPEPTTLGLIALGATTLLRRRRK